MEIPKCELKLELVKKTLLIVDDCVQLAIAMKRFLANQFDKVIITTNPEEATRILDGRCVSHVLCDLNLGDCESMNGLLYASKWRKDYPGVKRIVIFTGSDISDLTIPFYVDDIVSKALGPDAAAQALLSRRMKEK